MRCRPVAAFVLSIMGSFTCHDMAASQTFQFGAVGDTGYSKVGEEEFSRTVAAMNSQPLAFVVHIGDFQADPRGYVRAPDRITTPCSDVHYQRVLMQFQRSVRPFILTPGDNDWTDCHLLKAEPSIDPLERLATVRRMFFPDGKSLGAKSIAVRSQSENPTFDKFRENFAWRHNNVSFATMHIVGSNDNKGRTSDMDAEANERTAANISWMRQAFADAKRDSSIGLVLVTQANPGFETKWTPSLIDRYFRLFPGVNPPKSLPPSGFDEILKTLEEEMQSYSRPTLFIHGDTHIFHVNKPLLNSKTQRFFENFTCLEVFGDPESHWVRVTVNPSNPDLFTIEPQIIPENRAKPRG